MQNQKNHNYGYLGNPLVKKDGVEHSFTEEEVAEYVKCSANPVYFFKNYVKIINLDEGLVLFEPYPYQEKMISYLNDNRFSIILACRQSGKSISTMAYLLWVAVFTPDQYILILANKAEIARELLARITLMLENLPFFLQPGCKSLNKGSIEFSNNSKIVAGATGGSASRGRSANIIVLDEFAFVEHSDEFYTSTYPIISSGKKTKVVITSTANGIGNTFHRLWEGAVQGTNEYKPFTVSWDDVPGRDEKWKEETIANTSQLQFDQEFSNQFIGSGNTLINASTLLSFKAKDPIKVEGDFYAYAKPKKKHDYVMTVDVADGVGQDYSTFIIIDVSTKPFKQVGAYRNNAISPILFPNVIYKYAKKYNDAYVIVESNNSGQMVARDLHQDIEYENTHLESATKSDKIGVEMTKKVKRIGCFSIKDILETKKLELVDANTIMETATFVSKGQSYEASDGNHDDLMMNLVMFGYFLSTHQFSEMTDINLKEMMFAKQLREIEEDVPLPGFIDDASEYLRQQQMIEDARAHWPERKGAGSFEWWDPDGGGGDDYGSC